jgi:uncharacterized membrane protein (UPF0127 family)
MSSRTLRLRRIGDDAVVCSRLKLGESFRQQFLGLMGRSSMEDGEGLYLPSSSIHMMFMRFPIDALFVSAQGRDGRRTVVGLRPDLPAWRGLVLPVRGAQGVVEMPAGTIARVGLAVDDKVVFEPTPRMPDEASAA